MENILVRSVNWLGDAVMTTPALQRLREAKPDARITLLSSEKLAGLWEGQPFLDELMTFAQSDKPWQTARRLREKRFTNGLVFPNSFRAALEMWLAGIPLRAGYARSFRTLLLTNPVPSRAGAVPMVKPSARQVARRISSGAPPQLVPASAHHTYDYLNLVAALGASSEPLPPRIVINNDEAEKTAAKLGLPSSRDDKPFFGMNPGAEYGPAKRWPAESFIKAGAAIHAATRCRWIVFGGPGDAEITNFISTELGRLLPEHPVINLTGQTTLRELAAALKSCRLLLTNDSGPMHLAAAVGTPVVALFGSTTPAMTGPVFSPGAEILRAEDVSCSPCFLRQCPIDFRCMTRIQPAAVVEAALRACKAAK